MPMLRVNGTELYYEDTGGSGPAILFSHGLLWDTSLFAPQIAVLKSRYRCVDCSDIIAQASATPCRTHRKPDLVAGSRSIHPLQHEFKTEHQLELADHHDRRLLSAQTRRDRSRRPHP